jgi:hypothetical protein
VRYHAALGDFVVGLVGAGGGEGTYAAWQTRPTRLQASGPALDTAATLLAPHARGRSSEWLPFLARCCPVAAAAAQGSSAICLDMGEFQVPGLNAEALGADAPEDTRHAIRTLVQTASGRPGGFAAAALAAAPAAAAALCNPGLLRVYSLLPPSLAERAKVWGSHLSIKPGWVQTDRGFFDAPGAAAASLTPEDAANPTPDGLMPPVTMVFVAVEGARALVRARREAEVRAMAGLLRATMLSALDAVPEGYLCREQEGEFFWQGCGGGGGGWRPQWRGPAGC